MNNNNLAILFLVIAIASHLVAAHMHHVHQDEFDEYLVSEIKDLNNRLDNIAKQYNINFEGDVR